MRDLNHYLDLFDDTDTVDAKSVAEAIYAARHGDADEARPIAIRKITLALPAVDIFSGGRARELVAAELFLNSAQLHNASDWLDSALDVANMTRKEFGDRIDVSRQYVGKMCRGERSLSEAAREECWRLAEELS